MDMQLFKPLHNLLLFFSAVFFLAAFITLKKTLEIHYQQTTYVIGFARIFMLSAVYFSILWLLYTFTSRRMASQRIYRIHILLTVILTLLILAAALWSHPLLEWYLKGDPVHQGSLSVEIGNTIAGALLTFATVQLLYPLNLVIGLFKNKKA